MIEVIYKDEKQESKGNEEVFELPRNIRQIGLGNGDYRIYMEDYVYTFLGKLTQLEEDDKEKSRFAVLTGKLGHNDGIVYVFVKGAITVEDEEITEDHINLTDVLWQEIHEEQEKYFEGQEIVGWFFGEKGLAMEVPDLFLKVHLKHFGSDKILMLMDPGEKEEAFFRYDNNFLIRQNGFYLYYEKNPQMQNYMIEKNPEFYKNQKEEIPDEAVHTFRKIIQKKNRAKKQETEEHTSVFSYAATACLVLAIATVGGKVYQNYQLMENANRKAEQVSANTVVHEVEESKITKAPIEKKVTEAPKAAATVTPLITSTITKAPDPEAPITTKIADNKETAKTETTITSVPSESDKVYREEADTRKAEKRMRETETSAATRNTYVIRPGDTLYQISVANYGTTEKVSDICKANGIAEDEIIYPGQIIVLP